MPSIKDQSTVNKIAEVFCGEGKRNKAETLRIVGYKDSYCDNHGTGVVYTNSRVIAAIKHIDSAARAETGWDVETALTELRSRLAYVKAKAESGDTTAVTVQLQILREINDIMGLHKQRIVQEQDEERAIGAATAKLRDEMVQAYRAKRDKRIG